MSAPQMTTAEALRSALASTIACSAQVLQETVGKVFVTTVPELPVSAPASVDERSVFFPKARTTVLLADLIPAGQEAAAVAQAIALHHGFQAAQAVLGDRADELLGSEGNKTEYVVRSVGEGIGEDHGAFWSNEDGWVGLADATRFSLAERIYFHLPHTAGGDAEWMSDKEAHIVAATFRVERFNVRILRQGDSYGLKDCLVYGREEPSVEFYDAMQSAAKFGPRGQFVSRYLASTLLEPSASMGLLLDTGSPNWVVSGAGMHEVQKYIRAELMRGNEVLSKTSEVSEPGECAMVVSGRVRQALPAEDGYERGYRDALESMALALASKLAGPALDEAIVVALDAYANNVEHETDNRDHGPAV